MTDEELLKIDICSRLPYGVYTTSEYSPNGEKVSGIYPEGNGKYFLGDNLKIVHYPIKPILFPITSLTEEITFKGEKIVPMLELARIEGHLIEITEVRSVAGRLYTMTAKTEKPVKDVMFVFYSDDADFTITEAGSMESHDVWNTLKMYDWLNSHMIDYRSLIDKGLAVSVYDLKKNPYE